MRVINDRVTPNHPFLMVLIIAISGAIFLIELLLAIINELIIHTANPAVHH